MSAAGNCDATHDGPGVPVRDGVPPSTGAAATVARAGALPLTTRRMPAIVSTLPDMPFGSLGVFTGRATSSLLLPVL